MRRSPRSPSTPSRESRRLVLIRDAFYRQGTLRRIRWPLQPRSRDRHTVFHTMGRPLNGTLAPPWVFVRSSPVRSGRVRHPTLLSPAAPADGFTHRRSLRARSPFTRPCRSFCCAIAELIRDQTPPDDFCNYIRGTSNQTRALVFSLGRWPRPPSGSYTPRTLPCGSGDVRRAARRSLRRPRCWFFPLAQIYPTAMPSRAPRHRPVLPVRCIARINVHGSKDRAKDASRGACDDVSCLRPVPTL